MNPNYPVLFFDLDHTLWDFETNSVLALRTVYEETELKSKGILDFEDFNIAYHAINDKLWDRFRKGFLSREELRWKRMFQALVHYRVNDESLAKYMSEFYLEVLPQQTALFPDAKEVLQYCYDKGYQLHLITNGFEATQHQKLSNAGIHHFFDRMITSEQAMSMKPHPGIFEFAFSETGSQADQSLMIGDALDIDILGAQQVGMDQVYFNPKATAHNESPTFEIHHLNELKNIL